MIFGKTNKEWIDEQMQWTRWFAWHPIRLATGRFIWWQMLERRREAWIIHVERAYGPWEYRLISKEQW